MMPLRALVLWMFFLLGACRRKFRFADFHHNTKQHDNSLTKHLKMTAAAQESLIPGGFGLASFPRRAPPAHASIAAHEYAQQLRAPHTQRPSKRPLGPRRAAAALFQDQDPDAPWFEEPDAKQVAEPEPGTTEPEDYAEREAAKASSEEPSKLLKRSDVVNTKWALKVTPRPDGWMRGGVQNHEYTLLEDGSVVWGGSAGGFGTGGRWALRDGLLEVIRSTLLGLVTGRDYYVAQATVSLDGKLQFVLKGIVRSYNALYPVTTIADFEATRQPGRFVRDVAEEEKEQEVREGGGEGEG